MALRRGMQPPVRLCADGDGKRGGARRSAPAEREGGMDGMVQAVLEPAAAILRESAMTIEEKKAVLMRYRESERRIARMLEEKRRWAEKAAAISPVYSDMPRPPKGGRSDRIQDAVCSIADLERDIAREIGAQVRLRRRVERAVNRLEDDRLRDVVRYRYVDGYTWERIAEVMCYSPMQVCRLHAKALAAIVL